MKKKYLSEHNIYLQKKEIKTREEIDFIRLKKEKEKEEEKKTKNSKRKIKIGSCFV